MKMGKLLIVGLCYAVSWGHVTPLAQAEIDQSILPAIFQTPWIRGFRTGYPPTTTPPGLDVPARDGTSHRCVPALGSPPSVVVKPAFRSHVGHAATSSRSAMLRRSGEPRGLGMYDRGRGRDRHGRSARIVFAVGPPESATHCSGSAAGRAAGQRTFEHRHSYTPVNS